MNYKKYIISKFKQSLEYKVRIDERFSDAFKRLMEVTNALHDSKQLVTAENVFAMTKNNNITAYFCAMHNELDRSKR